MVSLIREPPVGLYVIDGALATRLAVPPGHVVLAFRAGQRPKILPLAPQSVSIELESDDARTAGMPMVLCSVPADEADRWLALAQSEADVVHGEGIGDWARGIRLSKSHTRSRSTKPVGAFSRVRCAGQHLQPNPDILW
jgi:hypothetical protein